MKPERWQQISRIFKSAISLEGDARAEYVAEECGTDNSLRADVEQLIESHHQAGAESFIGGFAAEEGAALLLDDDDLPGHHTGLTKGQQLG